MEDDVDLSEQLFHNKVREYVVCMLIFLTLNILSYVVLCAYKRRPDRDEYSVAPEDAIIYSISLLSCTFALAVSIGAVLLLPFSIVANEALHIFSNNYYLQWVNESLVQGLWNIIFLLSNFSLFVLMPFFYLFTESEGLPGSKRGIMPRVYETSLVFFLTGIVICGLAWVFLVLTGGRDDNNDKLLTTKKFSILSFDLCNFYIFYLYSCVSLLGVAMLLICTPVGFTRLFTVIGDLIIKPDYGRDFDGELERVKLEEIYLQRRINATWYTNNNSSYCYQAGVNGGSINNNEALFLDSLRENWQEKSAEFRSRLDSIVLRKFDLEKRLGISVIRKNVVLLGYPVAMLLLLTLMSISVFMVIWNICLLLIGSKSLNMGSRDVVLGVASLSKLGPFGAAIEVIVIIYLMSTSVVGFYSLPGFKRLLPKRNDTPMSLIIANCVIMLVLSSALPVLSRILGITNFDLLGNFGQLEWLGSFYTILSYNMIFFVVIAFCLSNRVSESIRKIFNSDTKELFKISSNNTL